MRARTSAVQAISGLYRCKLAAAIEKKLPGKLPNTKIKAQMMGQNPREAKVGTIVLLVLLCFTCGFQIWAHPA